MRADNAAVFVRLGDVVGADRDHAAIADLYFIMEFKQPLMLSAILGAVTPAAKDEHHRVLPLQRREFPALRSIVGELIVREDGPLEPCHVACDPPYVLRVTRLDALLSRRGRCLRPSGPRELVKLSFG